ncbi:urea carboxylase-associated family protein [Paenibacillaceae bacterium]|nr:urea carboxylase-associated family protein [Paenibacillaceae bacterium]
MLREITIAKQTGQAFKINKGERFSVIDMEGQQVADLFAVNSNEFDEFFSAAVTIDCKESLSISIGDILYSNRYQPMMTIIEDDVSVHELLIPSCRAETYQHFYNVGHHHSNCFDNINASLKQHGIPPFNSIQPLNIFMNTAVTPEQTILIRPPVSKAGDKITFKAELDLIVCISACSISEGACNAGRCKPVLIQILV